MNTALRLTAFAEHRPWLNTSLRTVLAIFGGYGLAALVAAVFALALPLPRVDAVMEATMSSFVIYLLATIWAFAAATLARAFAGLLLPAAVLGVCLGVLPAGGAA